MLRYTLLRKLLLDSHLNIFKKNTISAVNLKVLFQENLPYLLSRINDDTRNCVKDISKAVTSILSYRLSEYNISDLISELFHSPRITIVSFQEMQKTIYSKLK